MGIEAAVDFEQHGIAKAAVANKDHWLQGVGGGTQVAALSGADFKFWHTQYCTLMAKKKTSRAWMQRHVQDPYVRMAQQKGYRARAAFKLEEILDTEKLLRPGDIVIDLGAAPGSWAQLVRDRLLGPDGQIRGRIVALDILPMEPLAGVEFLQGDFRDESTLHELEETLRSRPVDLVISDMAPNLSGVASADSARIAHVCELAIDFARTHLRPEGALIMKAFHGSGFSQIVQDMKKHFVRVVERKPKASRPGSAETFLVGRGLKSP